MTVELVSADGVELWLAVAVGGSLAVVCAGAGAALGSGIDGAEAIAPAVLAFELGVEGMVLAVEGIGLGAGAVFRLGGLLVLAEMEPCVSALTLALERAAGSRVERLEVLLAAALFAGVLAAFTLSGAAGVAGGALDSGSVVAAAGAGIGVAEADLLASATTGARAAGAAVFSVSLRLWLSTSAPPITVAVMVPNAIPK